MMPGSLLEWVRRLCRLTAAAGMLVAAPAILTADAPTFFEGGNESFPVGSIPTTLAVTDLNGDDKPDVVVVHESSGRISVLLQGAAEGLLPFVPYAVGLGPIYVMTGDIAQNGAPDVLVINSGSSTMSILPGNGDGSLQPAHELPLGSAPRAGSLADLDGDGALDVVASNFGSLDISILLGDGKGGFPQVKRINIGDNPHSVAVADWTRDGRADIAIAHRGAAFSGVTLLPSQGGGGFERGVDFPLDDTPRWLAVGDLDTDAFPDIAVLGDEGRLFLLKNRSGVFFEVEDIAAAAQRGAAGESAFLLVTDFDGDGSLDLVRKLEKLGNFGIRVHSRDAEGRFTRESDIYLGQAAAAAAFKDMDADGLTDAVVARASSPEISIVRSLAPGKLDARVALPLEQGARALLPLDLDRDGRLDILAMVASSIALRRGRTDGELEPAASPGVSGIAFEDMAEGDFDGDGSRDLAVADLGAGKVLLSTLDTEAAGRKPIERIAHDLPLRLVSGDFDGDGSDDLAATDRAYSALSLWLAPGREDSGSVVDLASDGPLSAVKTADTDADGALDLVAASAGGILSFLGDGKGAFRRGRDLAVPGAAALELADLDGDGAMDVAAAAGSSIQVALGLASSLPGRLEIKIDAPLRALSAADLDGDGLLEVGSVSGVPTGALFVNRGLPIGGFEEAEKYWLGAAPRALLFVDLNGDARLDCVTADFGSRSLSILRGRVVAHAASFLRGDADLDGRNTLTDAVTILSRLFLGRDSLPCEDAADADDDGHVLLTDAVFLLLHLFSGGPSPPPPFDSCGEDSTEDALRCASNAACVVPPR